MKKYAEINNRTFEVVPRLQVSNDYITNIYMAYKNHLNIK